MEKSSKRFGLSSFDLHIIAMAFMLLDHSWATIFSQYRWLNCVGRLAFPIFAFMIVEGWYHTSDRKKYFLRMVLFAVVSELPFNLMCGGTLLYPVHQNVMWTFAIAMMGLFGMEKLKNKSKLLRIVGNTVIVIGTSIMAIIGMTDYHAAGVLTVYAFYLFHGKNYFCYVGQFALLYYLNVRLLGGLRVDVNLFGYSVEVVQQGLALLALPLIWLYNGERGCHSKWFQYACYAFYPLHALILSLIALYLM